MINGAASKVIQQTPITTQRIIKMLNKEQANHIVFTPNEFFNLSLQCYFLYSSSVGGETTLSNGTKLLSSELTNPLALHEFPPIQSFPSSSYKKLQNVYHTLHEMFCKATMFIQKLKDKE